MFVIVVNLFAEIPFGWWGMITGLRIMSRLRKCSKQLQHAKAFLGAITVAEVSC